MILGWLRKKYKEWKDSGEQLKALDNEAKKALDEVHKKVQSGELSGDQLESVSLCAQSITINLQKGTQKLRGGVK